VTQQNESESGKSRLQDTLAKLDAIRDLPKDRDLGNARLLELQIYDIGAYVDSQRTLVSSPGLRIVRGFGGQTQQTQQPSQQRGYRKRDYQHER
jgi:hypothetical protein